MSKIETQNQMYAMIEECNQSGLSKRDYCMSKNMNEARFLLLAKKYQEKDKSNSGFIKPDTRSGSKQSKTIEIIFPNGVRIATDLS